MKLVSITFESIPRIPGVRPGTIATIECDRPHPNLKGWCLKVRGAAVFLVGPADPVTGTSTVYEFARSSVYLNWSGRESELDAYAKANRYDSPPFGEQKPADSETPAPPKGFLSQLDPKDLGDK